EGDSCVSGRCVAGPDTCEGAVPNEPAPPPPFDEVPGPESPEAPEGCSSTTSAPTLALALLALLGLRRRRAPASWACVCLLSGSAVAADVDSDTIDDTIDRCAAGDDRVDSDSDGTPDDCDCAPDDPAI